MYRSQLAVQGILNSKLLLQFSSRNCPLPLSQIQCLAHSSSENEFDQMFDHLRNIKSPYKSKPSKTKSRKTSQSNDMQARSKNYFNKNSTDISSLQGSKSLPSMNPSKNMIVESSPDVFGTLFEQKQETQPSNHNVLLRKDHKFDYFEEEEDNDEIVYDHRLRLAETGRRHEPEWYFRKIKALTQNGRLKEALQIFYHDMLVHDRVMPNRSIILALLEPIAQAGLSSAAVRLFRKGKEFDFQPSQSMYSMVFVAFANDAQIVRKKLKDSEICQKELKIIGERAKYFWNKLKNENVKLSIISYNSIVMAMSKAGLLQDALRAVDEMRAANIKPDNYTYVNLLMGCRLEARMGSGVALMLSRHFLSDRRFRCSEHSITLLLDVLRTCSIGDAQFIRDTPFLFESVSATLPALLTGAGGADAAVTKENEKEELRVEVAEKMADRLIELAQEGKQGSDTKDDEILIDLTNRLKYLEDSAIVPLESENLQASIEAEVMQKSPINVLNNLDKKLSLSEMNFSPSSASMSDQPWHRLSLIGGIDGVIQLLKSKRLKANIFHFTCLMKFLPDLRNYHNRNCDIHKPLESHIRQLMQQHDVTPDVPFYNMLISTRATDYESAITYLAEMTQQGLRPDNITYGSIALWCNDTTKIKVLLTGMKIKNLSPSLILFNCLFHNSQHNWIVKSHLLKEMQEVNCRPDNTMITLIEKQIHDFRLKIVADKEETVVSAHNRRNYYRFLEQYNHWLDHIEIDNSMLSERKQYDVNSRDAFHL